MTLAQKYANLTPARQEALAALKSASELDTFLAEAGIALSDEERKLTADYLNTGALPLSDEDLDSVAGGKDDGNRHEGVTRRNDFPDEIVFHA